jgi:hypothetical protein
MISEEGFYGRSKAVSLTGDYTVDYRVARLWSFTPPTASGHKVILPNPDGLKLGGIYFIIINHSDTYTFTVVDHDDNTLTLVDTEEGCVISLSESEFTIGPAMVGAMPPVAPILIGKWGLLGIPPVYAGSGTPSVYGYWNWKILTLGAAEGLKSIRHYLFGGANDYTGCDQHEFVGDTWTAKTNIPDNHASSWSFSPTLHHVMVAIGSAEDKLYKFRPTENTWTDEGSTPEPHEGGTAFAIKGVGYALGGTTAKFMEAYSARTWTRKRETDFYTYGCSSAADDDKGYFTNGYDVIAGGPNNHHFEYDPITDVWTQKDDLPQAAGKDIYQHSGFMIHDVGVYYVVGGITPAPTTTIDDMSGWVPSTDTWSTKDVLPAARNQGATASGHYPGAGAGQLGVYYCGYNVTEQDDVYLYRAVSPADDWTTLAATAPANKRAPSVAVAGV